MHMVQIMLNNVKYTIQQLPQRYARVAHESNDLHRHGDLTTHRVSEGQHDDCGYFGIADVT